METPQKTLKKLPHAPGIYIYKNTDGHILYIGKAKDLKKRVPHFKTELFSSRVAAIETIQTVSEFDALLLEAALIRKHMPKYNVVLKDDKSSLYILLTLSEPLPHVFTLRRSDLPKKMHKKDALFGPFQSAGVVRSLLRHLRHSVPYCTQKRRTGKPCFYSHIGLCYPCPSDAKTDPHVYRKNIYRLKNILSGKSHTVLKELEKDMKKAAKEQNFEEAARLRNHIQNLYGMLSKKYDPMLYVSSDTAVEDIYANELAALSDVLHIPHLHRIECYDISNTGGKNATGSMVVLTDGRKDTSEYKRFRIRQENVPNDTAMIAEVVTRRLAHSEWPKPGLIIIDGGKGQITAVKNITKNIPVIGLAKRFEEIVIPQGEKFKVIRLDLTSPALHVLQRIRDESHRFALSYHRLLRKKSFFSNAVDKYL